MYKPSRLYLSSVILLLTLLAACGSANQGTEATSPASGTDTGNTMAGGMMADGGMMAGGMMARHHAQTPPEYTGLSNPVPRDAESVARGAALFELHCIVCHGANGLGDGVGAAALDPAPPALAHTASMLGDDFIFWRISEGGLAAPFNSAMPAWGEALAAEARWDLVNYVRALSAGEVNPAAAAGAMAGEAVQRAEMLAAAVAQGVLTSDEAALFDRVHDALDTMPMVDETGQQGGMNQILEENLAQLVAEGSITQADADAFLAQHDRLLEAGLMH